MTSHIKQSTIFESLHQQYHPMVLQMCLGYMKGDVDLAKDIAQEIFINVWNALPNFKGESSHKTWIYRITVNTCLLYLRDNKKRQADFIEALPQNEKIELIEKEKDEYAPLYTAIGELPQMDRIIMMLVLDEVEYDEIAKITGISHINLRVKIHRIKKKIKQFFTKQL